MLPAGRRCRTTDHELDVEDVVIAAADLVTVQGGQHQDPGAAALGLDVLTYGRHVEDPRVDVVVDADHRDVVRHGQTPAPGRAHHAEGHLVGCRYDTGGVVES